LYAIPSPSIVFIIFTTRRPSRSTLFPYTTLFRSQDASYPRPADARELRVDQAAQAGVVAGRDAGVRCDDAAWRRERPRGAGWLRSEEHTSDSSHVKISYAVFCLKKKKTIQNKAAP